MNRKICKICGGKTTIKYRRLYDDRHGSPGKFDLLECHNCGFMQTKPQLTPKQIMTIYSKYYPRQKVDIEVVKKTGKNMPTKAMIKDKGLSGTCHFDTRKGEKVLDIGSGTGYSLMEIKALRGEAWGIDPDANAKKVAQKLKLKFHHGFLRGARLPKRYFDLITASQVLEHVPDPLTMLLDCKGYLKNGGRIRMSFPNTGALYRKLWGRQWLHWHIPYHLNHFNKRSLRILTEKAGLKIHKLETVTPNLWTILQVRSWMAQTKVGERNTMWDTGQMDTKKIEKKKDWLRLISLRLLPALEKMLSINRMIDRYGGGESFVVEFRER